MARGTKGQFLSVRAEERNDTRGSRRNVFPRRRDCYIVHINRVIKRVYQRLIVALTLKEGEEKRVLVSLAHTTVSTRGLPVFSLRQDRTSIDHSSSTRSYIGFSLGPTQVCEATNIVTDRRRNLSGFHGKIVCDNEF